MIAPAKRGGIVVVLALGCGPVVDASDVTTNDASTTGVPSPTTSGAGEHATVADEVTTVQPDPTSADESTMSASSESSESSTSPSFIPSHDVRFVDECSLWEQDCPRGDKCMPWANDGGGSWNATRCSPIDPDPRDVGEECMVEGSGVSGIDNCILDAMCWNVDPDTNMGECVAFCQGTKAAPSCADACNECFINGEGTLALCLADCDPLAQECGEGRACYPVAKTFSCEVDASEGAGGIGEPCEYLNVCQAGSYCAEADRVPDCADDVGCCAPFCNLELADDCEALLPGTVCTPWYEAGQAPQDGCIDHDRIGVCAVP